MSPLEALGAELGAIAARIDRETSLRLDAALADLKRHSAEMDLRFERLERSFSDRVAGIKDGSSVTPADVAPMVEDAVRSAVSAATETMRQQVSDEIAEKVAALPKPKDGVDADPVSVAGALRSALLPDVVSMIAERIAEIELPEPTVDKDVLTAVVKEAVDALPPAEPGKDADPAEVAKTLADLITPDVQEMIAAEAAKMSPPVVDEALVVEAVNRAVEALPAPAPGRDADMDAVRTFIVEEIANIPAPKDGQTPSAEDIQPLVDKAVAEAVAALPVPKDGADADMEVVRQMVRDEVAALPVAKDGEEPSDERIVNLAAPIIARMVADIPPAAPGKDADPDDIRRMVQEAVDALPPAKDGEMPSPEAIRSVVEEVVKAAVEALPEPKDGEDGKSVDPDEVRQMVGQLVDVAISSLPVPKDGKDGRLPVVRAWEDRVYYEGEVCSFEGATYQASVDTGRAPPDADWTCLAAKGRDGIDAQQIDLCGTFDEAREYRRLSVVMLNGASFISKKDDPGPCPGEGWQLMAQQGKRGGPGQVTRADRGTRPADMSIGEDGVLTLTMDDGTKVECDLYPLLSRL